MIRSFRSKALKRYAETGDASKLSVPNVDRVRRILRALNEAKKPEQMNIPGYRFHPLKGRDKERYAVDASGCWRIPFGWDDTDATDVDLEDYH
ncbi:MAG TPA: type II toxin-antitoxin system RelE/ParE family toxin [Xanthobacteraceae bacterium]|nr:type II toxin-antitoxin system RelE/ParE family toxin [Xanthobacteraceae bacterium]